MHIITYMKTADFFKILAEPTRYRLLHALTLGEFCVCELVDAIQAPQYAVSRHLAGLRKGGWVTERRDGTWIYYRLASGHAALIKDVIRLAVKHGRDAEMLAKDGRRLKKRLTLRESGRCVLGYDEI